MPKTTSSAPLRRSGRVNIACPVRISGMLAKSLPFEENAQVVTVSKFGAKLKTHTSLRVGMQLKVQPLLGARSGLFTVVWVGREGTPRASEVGVEYAGEISGILGINFPDSNAPVKLTDRDRKKR